MSAMRSGIEAAGGGLAGPLVGGKGIKRVRLGSEDWEVPQGVFGLDAISQQTVGSEDIFMARYRVPPGTQSSVHAHTNCKTAVYVLRGRAYAYSGKDMGEYIEAGEPLEYVVARNAPEEVVVTLRAAEDLLIGPDGRQFSGGVSFEGGQTGA
jgi:uncharacterized RmlC-like cupin family protein